MSRASSTTFAGSRGSPPGKYLRTTSPLGFAPGCAWARRSPRCSRRTPPSMASRAGETRRRCTCGTSASSTVCSRMRSTCTSFATGATPRLPSSTCRQASSRRRGHIRRAQPASPASGGRRFAARRPSGARWARCAISRCATRIWSPTLRASSAASATSRRCPSSLRCSSTQVPWTLRRSRTTSDCSSLPRAECATGGAR